MGGVFPSTSDPPNPANPNLDSPAASAASTAPRMSSPDPQPSELPIPPGPSDSPQPDAENLESQGPSPQPEQEDRDGQEEAEEEEGECGFCLFMKGGGCKDTFIDWEKCIEEAEKNKEDIVEKCFQATAALKKCMEAHSDYYEPILRAEKAAEEEAVRELEKEAASKDAEIKSAGAEQRIDGNEKPIGQTEDSK